jgi:hypothetical protein
LVGGDCTSHSFCPSKFSCIGCPAKVPDPARKQEIVFQKRWALDSAQQYESPGLLPEATKLKQVAKDSDKELGEIELIEIYREDGEYEADYRYEDKSDLA